MSPTDSELAFCALLARLRKSWSGADVPSLNARLSVLASVPLTHEAWQTMHDGQLIAVRGGQVVAQQFMKAF